MGSKIAIVVASLLVALLPLGCADSGSVGQDPSPMPASLAGLAEAHGRRFGTAVVHDALFDTTQPELARRYTTTLAREFNLLVPESELKMANVWTAESTLDLRKADRIAAWAVAHNVKMRAHSLVWYRSVPPWLVAGYRRGDYSREQVAALVQWYISRVMTHYKASYPGLVVAWDVVNEAIGPNDPTTSDTFGLRPVGTDFQDSGADFWRLTLGDDYVEKAFHWARAADPDARLFYNDDHAEFPNPKGEAIYTFVTALKAAGTPIDGIGLECHLDVSYLDMSLPGIVFTPEAISATVDRWIRTGLEVQVTEADISMKVGQDDRQAKLYADLLRASLPKAGVTAFTTWGFTDLVSWHAASTPLYFDRDIAPKPAYFALLEALRTWDGK